MRYLKRLLLVILILLAIFLLWRWLRPHPMDTGSQASSCLALAESQLSVWKQAGKTEAQIEQLYQTELAKCSGVKGACSAFVAAVNVDYAWLGRQLLSGSLAPAEYLARIHDRSAKLRLTRQRPDICDAYLRGDADGDLVPDENDRCPNTPTLSPTGPDGCPDKTPLPPAPSAEAVANAANALKVPLTKACQPAPVPGVSAVLRAGLNPSDPDAFLIEVAPITNQPAACPVFYEIEARISNSSFFSGTQSVNLIRRVFRPADAVHLTSGGGQGLVFSLRRADQPLWNALVSSGIEPSDHAIKNLRVRAVNGNGSSAGWSSFRTREFRLNNRNFQ